MRSLDVVRQVVSETNTTIEQAQKEASWTMSPMRKEMQSSQTYLERVVEELHGQEELNKHEADVVIGCVAPIVAKFELDVTVPTLENSTGTRHAITFAREAYKALKQKQENYR